MEYLVDRYDKDHKLSSTGQDKYIELQWIAFQVSGQGYASFPTGVYNASLTQRCHSPYFGQSAWFRNFHSEKIPSAIERYDNEIKRVFGVLDSVLSKQKYLVGNKVTIADLSFIMWNSMVVNWLIPDIDIEKNYPGLAR